MNLPLPIQALETFSAQLARGGKVLCMDPVASEWLTLRGLEIQALPPDKDLRLLSLKRESYAGVWAGNALSSIPIDDAQRVIAGFFQALLPGKGVLFAAYSYPQAAFASLLRQNGYLMLMEGQNEDTPKAAAMTVPVGMPITMPIKCVVAQRI